MNESEFVLGGDELRNIKIKQTHEQPFKKAPVTNRQGLSTIKWHIYAKVKNDCKSAVPAVNQNTSAIVALARPVSPLYFDLQTRGRYVNS